jgi:hypothetical protein
MAETALQTDKARPPCLVYITANVVRGSDEPTPADAGLLLAAIDNLYRGCVLAYGDDFGDHPPTSKRGFKYSILRRDDNLVLVEVHYASPLEVVVGVVTLSAAAIGAIWALLQIADKVWFSWFSPAAREKRQLELEKLRLELEKLRPAPSADAKPRAGEPLRALSDEEAYAILLATPHIEGTAKERIDYLRQLRFKIHRVLIEIKGRVL